MSRFKRKNGFTLVEVVLVIVIIGIITSIAIKSLSKSTEIARAEETKKELEKLARAITGRSDLLTNGIRTDYGYVGDVGALPASLDHLITRPPGYTSWDGPYIFDDFSEDGSSSEFKKDAWGVNYTYNGSVTISSTGGGNTITRNLANSVDDLLYNRVICVVTDLDQTPPGDTYKDSVVVSLRFPDGSGSYSTHYRNPDSNGLTEFDSIPTGLHELRVIYTPLYDTLRRIVNIDAGTDYYAEISLFEDTW
ncbi:MAG: prepilin-type N-terminal cleavage/methylation domain-containing protein [Candidatus Zixiibacteriota bacterium]